MDFWVITVVARYFRICRGSPLGVRRVEQDVAGREYFVVSLRSSVFGPGPLAAVNREAEDPTVHSDACRDQVEDVDFVEPKTHPAAVGRDFGQSMPAVMRPTEPTAGKLEACRSVLREERTNSVSS